MNWKLLLILAVYIVLLTTAEGFMGFKRKLQGGGKIKAAKGSVDPKKAFCPGKWGNKGRSAHECITRGKTRGGKYDCQCFQKGWKCTFGGGKGPFGKLTNRCKATFDRKYIYHTGDFSCFGDKTCVCHGNGLRCHHAGNRKKQIPVYPKPWFWEDGDHWGKK